MKAFPGYTTIFVRRTRAVLSFKLDRFLSYITHFQCAFSRCFPTDDSLSRPPRGGRPISANYQITDAIKNYFRLSGFIDVKRPGCVIKTMNYETTNEFL